MSKVLHISVWVGAHLLERPNQLIVEDVGVYVLTLGVDYLAHAELHVGDVVLGGFKENWNNMLSDLVLQYEWHDDGE